MAILKLLALSAVRSVWLKVLILLAAMLALSLAAGAPVCIGCI